MLLLEQGRDDPEPTQPETIRGVLSEDRSQGHSQFGANPEPDENGIQSRPGFELTAVKPRKNKKWSRGISHSKSQSRA